MLEFYPIEMRATLFALHWVALFVGAWLLFRHQSVVAEPAEKQGIAFEVGVIICTLIACFTPIRYFWTFMHLFPGHVTSDLYGGLPISDVTSQSLAGYVFNDFGRSSYIYHLLLAGLYRIPGFEIPHLFPLFLVLACLFVYVWIRAVGRASFPALGLLVVLFSPEAWEHLVESFLSRRSWGTELVSLGVALLMLAPGNVRTSRYALSGLFESCRARQAIAVASLSWVWDWSSSDLVRRTIVSPIAIHPGSFSTLLWRAPVDDGSSSELRVYGRHNEWRHPAGGVFGLVGPTAERWRVGVVRGPGAAAARATAA